MKRPTNEALIMSLTWPQFFTPDIQDAIKTIIVSRWTRQSAVDGVAVDLDDDFINGRIVAKAEGLRFIVGAFIIDWGEPEVQYVIYDNLSFKI